MAQPSFTIQHGNLHYTATAMESANTLMQYTTLLEYTH